MAEKDYTPTQSKMSTVSCSKDTKKKYKPKRPRGFGHVVTYKNRRSPYVAFFNDSSGSPKTKSFRDYDEAEKFLDDLYFNRERVADATNVGVTLAAYSEVFLAKQRDSKLFLQKNRVCRLPVCQSVTLEPEACVECLSCRCTFLL